MTDDQPSARLTDHDRRIIAEARQVAGLGGSDTIRAHLEAAGAMKPGESDEAVYPVAYGRARWLLGELAAIAERLGEDGSDE